MRLAVLIVATMLAPVAARAQMPSGAQMPDPKQMYEGTEAFFKEYQARASAAGVDALISHW